MSDYHVRAHCLAEAIRSGKEPASDAEIVGRAKAFERYLTGDVTVEISVSAPASVAHDVAKVLRDAGGQVA